MSPLLIHTKAEFNLNLKNSPQIPLPQKVLMVTPTYFNIETPINAHMLDAQGHVHVLDKQKALKQWQTLKETYEKLNFSVSVVEGKENCPDMVFCANQSFPYLFKNQSKAILSNMQNDIRHEEVETINAFLKSKQYTTQHLEPRSQKTLFEGMGDVTWLGRTQFLLGGHGFRTSPKMYEKLAELVQCPIALFELKNPKFYHLDTCLSILNSTTALVCKEAFTTEGFELLQVLIPNLILVTLKEADAPYFACNAHCPDEKHVIIQKGSSETCAHLKEHHFVPIEIDTSEFIKSGGSVYCMKLMYF